MSRGAGGSFGILSCPGDGEVPTNGRANVGPREDREPNRAVKAGRRPPGGEALTARSVALHILCCEARQGFVVVPLWCRVGNALRPISRASECQQGNPMNRVPVICPSREATWSGSAATRWAQSKPRSRRCAGTMTIAELAPGCVRPGSHPVSARQRISPSRRP